MDEREEQLSLLNKSIFWLAILGFAFLLSVLTVLRQRTALCLILEGDAEGAAAAGAVFPLRSAASTLYVLGLTFFWYAVQGREAASLTPQQERSRCLNRWAALFVLAGAILRLWDVNETQCRLTAGQ